MSGGGCSVRAIWILTPHDAVAFSRCPSELFRSGFGPSDPLGLTSFFLPSVRRFAVVEKRWRSSWEAECGGGGDGDGRGAGAPTPPQLPDDHEVAAAFADRRRRLAVVPLVLRSAYGVRMRAD